MVTGLGLRERKKQATRTALRMAAMRLAVSRGIDHVTAEEIAAEAGVSARTFFNYFATKEEAFVADDLERGHRFVAAVKAAPDGAPLWSLLHQTAKDVFGGSDLPKAEQALKEQLLRASPVALGHVLATITRLEHELVAELTRRTPSGSGLGPRLMAGGVAAAVRSAADTWLAADPSGGHEPALTDLLDEAFAALAPAFDSP